MVLEDSYLKGEGTPSEPKTFTLLGSQGVSGEVKDTAPGSYVGEHSLLPCQPLPQPVNLQVAVSQGQVGSVLGAV